MIGIGSNVGLNSWVLPLSSKANEDLNLLMGGGSPLVYAFFLFSEGRIIGARLPTRRGFLGFQCSGSFMITYLRVKTRTVERA